MYGRREFASWENPVSWTMAQRLKRRGGCISWPIPWGRSCAGDAARMLRGSGGDQAMAPDRCGGVGPRPMWISTSSETGSRAPRPEAPRITVITSSRDRGLQGLSAHRGRRRPGGGGRARATSRLWCVRRCGCERFRSGLLNHDLFLSDEEVRGVVARAIERARCTGKPGRPALSAPRPGEDPASGEIRRLDDAHADLRAHLYAQRHQRPSLAGKGAKPEAISRLSSMKRTASRTDDAPRGNGP